MGVSARMGVKSVAKEIRVAKGVGSEILYQKVVSDSSVGTGPDLVSFLVNRILLVVINPRWGYLLTSPYSLKPQPSAPLPPPSTSPIAVLLHTVCPQTSPLTTPRRSRSNPHPPPLSISSSSSFSLFSTNPRTRSLCACTKAGAKA